MKTESLVPPFCLLGDDPTSPFETVQINVGPTSDDLSGNNSLPPPCPQVFPKQGKWERGCRQQEREEERANRGEAESEWGQRI